MQSDRVLTQSSGGASHDHQDQDGRGTSRIRRSRRRRSYHSRREFIKRRRGRRDRRRRRRRLRRGGARPGRRRRACADLPNVKKSSYVTDAEVDPVNTLRPDHDLQQLLRVRHATRATRRATPAGSTTQPWTVKVDGLVGKPGDYGDRRSRSTSTQLEERIYRHRCVEAWSMVIPWIGVSAVETCSTKVQPQPQAKFVEFTTLMRPSEMPGLQHGRHRRGRTSKACAWTRRCTRSTLMVVGLYGKVLPNQNGAPLRVHIPWKYGFKSGKSIVRIRFTDTTAARTRGRCRRRTNTASTPT